MRTDRIPIRINPVRPVRPVRESTTEQGDDVSEPESDATEQDPDAPKGTSPSSDPGPSEATDEERDVPQRRSGFDAYA